jgi:transcriptional regulator with PAS, ATPase and Fis domain
MMSHHSPPIIGCSEPAEKLRDDIEKVAQTNMTVMIRGERGTGKDVVANEIHRRSRRSGGPFIKVNCGALPQELVESELFGVAKGAFTNAVERPGKFELAHGGTIFLDEVGELDHKAQPKLLQVTESFTVDRVGGRLPIPVDFRLIVATNRNLEEMAEQGKFRDDLYDRLNMFSISVPPLRDRKDDIPLLVDYFIGDCVSQAQRIVEGATPEVLEIFHQYWWPGNVRELRAVINRVVFTGKSDWISEEDLAFFKQKTAPTPIKSGTYNEQMREYSRQLLLAVLQECGGNKTKAAKRLGLMRSKLYRLLDLHGLDGESPRDGRGETDWL